MSELTAVGESVKSLFADMGRGSRSLVISDLNTALSEANSPEEVRKVLEGTWVTLFPEHKPSAILAGEFGTGNALAFLAGALDAARYLVNKELQPGEEIN
jgi:hypothetical protein